MPTAFITGGTKRIGRYIAKIFAEKGYDLILHDHSDISQREAVRHELSQFTNKISFLNADLLNENKIEALCNDIEDICNIPDTIIHTASLFEKDDFHNFKRASWHKHMDIHVLAPLEITQYFAGKISQSKTTHKMNVIFLIDQRVSNPNPDFFSYTASKMLVTNLIQTTAMALSPHIRINGVSPGPTLKNVRQAQEDFDLQSSLTPLGHSVPPEDIANACFFLSETNSVTGQIITVDSGQSLDWRTDAYMRVKE